MVQGPHLSQQIKQILEEIVSSLIKLMSIPGVGFVLGEEEKGGVLFECSAICFRQPNTFQRISLKNILWLPQYISKSSKIVGLYISYPNERPS